MGSDENIEINGPRNPNNDPILTYQSNKQTSHRRCGVLKLLTGRFVVRVTITLLPWQ
jgi:hypothetical protein